MKKEILAKNFIEKANLKWNHKYDYSKIEYVNRKTPICIICPEHGEFWITPQQHLWGHGCTKCAKNGKKTTESFIEECVQTHGDKYDYSKTVYINALEKVCIICPEHGEFWQLPNAHKRGQGCPECANRGGTKKAINNNEQGLQLFLKQAKEIHGDKYDYSKSVYETRKHSVCIICPEHGEFWQRPDVHLKGSGCPQCSRQKIGQYHAFDTQSWIDKAKEIHSDKYDYSKVEYVNNCTKVCIICHKKDEFGNEHGEFWQLPNSHLQKNNCPKCGQESRVQTVVQKYNTEWFINEAKLKHNDKYDYSKTDYNGWNKKVCIICPEHGEFWQVAQTHLTPKGCPKCKTSKMENEINKLLENNCINFKYDCTLDFLKINSRKRLRLDFYLPDYNIAIECQGTQHFIPSDFSGNKTEEEKNTYFKKCQERDLRKKQLCEENGVKILYYANETISIPDDFNLYTVIRNKDELIKEILSS